MKPTPASAPRLGCNPFTAVLSLMLMAALVLVGPLAVPVGPQAEALPSSALADPDSRFVTLNAVRVHYKEQGAGRVTLIFIHGLGASTFTWAQVLPALAPTARVLAFDRPGFGLTSRPLPGEWIGLNPYSPEGQVELTLDLMDELGVEQAVLVGNSAGGTLAAQVALAAPQRVQALVLVSAAIYQGGGTPEMLAPVLSSPQAQHLGPLVGRAFISNLPQFLTSFWADPSRLTPEIVAGYQKPFRAERAEAGFWQVVAASRATNLAPRLAGLTMPTLVVTGAQDTTVPVAQSEQLARDLPNAQLVMLPNCGHLPQEECPAALAEALVAFVRAVP